MIDERTLAGLLSDHAERIPVPTSAIDALLAASPAAERSPVARRPARTPARVLAAAAVVVVATGSLRAYTDHSRDAGTVRTDAVKTKAQPPSQPPPGGVASSPPTTIPGPAQQYVQRGDAFTTAGLAPYNKLTHNAPKPPNAVADSTKPQAALPSRVVRTGTLDLRIARHSFGTTMGRITTIAAAAGGFVADAKTFESAATPSGTATIRVPSARFNAAVDKLRAMGKVVSASTRGEDVTGQYTDLSARLRAATSSRAAYLSVLSHATNIGDILAVQDRIEAVQTQIEQLQGQLQQLNDQTTYATLTISVNEPASKANVVAGRHQSGLSKAWDNARDGFARRVEGLISHSGSALVVLVALLLVAGALRLLIPRMRRLLV